MAQQTMTGRAGVARASAGAAPEAGMRIVGALLALGVAAAHVADQGSVTTFTNRLDRLGVPADRGGRRARRAGDAAALAGRARAALAAVGGRRAPGRRAVHRLRCLAHRGRCRVTPGMSATGATGWARCRCCVDATLVLLSASMLLALRHTTVTRMVTDHDRDGHVVGARGAGRFGRKGRVGPRALIGAVLGAGNDRAVSTYGVQFPECGHTGGWYRWPNRLSVQPVRDSSGD